MRLSRMILKEAPTNFNITLPPVTSLVHNSCIQPTEDEGVKEPQKDKEIINHLIQKHEQSKAKSINAVADSLTKVQFSLGQTSTEHDPLRASPLLCPTHNLTRDKYFSVPWTVFFCSNIFAQAFASVWKASCLFSLCLLKFYPIFQGISSLSLS